MDQFEKKNAKAIATFLCDKSSPLNTLFKKAATIQIVDQKLKKVLDPGLQAHFELANINTDVAILLVSSSAWATRLRYNIPAILNALNNQLNYKSVKTIRIKVQHSMPDKPKLNKKPVNLSDNSAQFLNDAAKNFIDPELRNCFLKLSKNRQ